jgi:hypothetical protein
VLVLAGGGNFDGVPAGSESREKQKVAIKFARKMEKDVGEKPQGSEDSALRYREEI